MLAMISVRHKASCQNNIRTHTCQRTCFVSVLVVTVHKMRSTNGTVITRPPKLSFLVHNAFDGDNPSFTFLSVSWKSVSPSVAATGDTTTGVHHEVRLSLFKRAWRVKNTANMADMWSVTRHAETSDGDGAHNGDSSKVPHWSDRCGI